MVEHVVIMAGGEGARLRPLTAVRPKPLLPLLDEPVAGYALQLLRRHGVQRATMALRCGAEQIMHAFGDGRAYGVSLDHVVEEEPCGTAGCVRLAAPEATGTVLAISGDILTDCDLTAMLKAHRASGAAATIALTEAEDAGDYGVCETDGNGRVVCFREKPGRAADAHSLVNAGIYLLEPEALRGVPPGMPWDFGRDVFPRLAQAGQLNGWRIQGYWTDVGTPQRYAQAQTDLLMGRVGMPVRGRRKGQAILAPGARIDAQARITGRCYVGAGATVGPGAELGEGAVLCAASHVGGGTYVEHACLWAYVRVEGSAVVRQVVILPENGNACLRRIVPYPVPEARQMAKYPIKKEG